MRHSFVLAALGTVLLSVAGVRVGRAQEVQLADRSPRFLLAASATTTPTVVEAQSVAVLRRRISMDLDGVTLEEALRRISRAAGLRLLYSKAVVRLDAPVQFRASNITVAAALTEVLFDAGVDVLITAGGSAVLTKRVGAAVTPPLSEGGTLVGRVTVAATGQGLSGADVTLDGTRLRAMTGPDGRYRIVEVAPGTYTVRARYIGYAPASTSVVVNAGQETTADFTLDRSAQQLSEVVTTGTVVPTEVKALPTPVSVISQTDIELRRPRTVGDLLRQLVPTAVTWDFPTDPSSTVTSVRGASSLEASGQIKVFVDGIEVASNGRAPVNPNSIERIEVIRGPQAAAIYGSDASGGVMQIFTKQGDPSRSHPELELQAAAGLMQTPYSGYGTVLRQTYTASVSGGGGDASYAVGGGYTHVGDWLPHQAETRQSNPNIYGATHFARGVLGVDVFARHEQYNEPQAYNPALAGLGLPTYTLPFYQPSPLWFQTVGARLSAKATSWWQHTITVGFDRFAYDRHQTQAVRSFPGDTLLQVDDEEGIKNSVRYSTSVQGSLGGDVTGSVIAGFDHYSYRDNEFYTYGATRITGTIQTDPAQPVIGVRNITNNTGYFAQAQVGYHDALFLTLGLRAEQNTNFGDSLSTPLSPRVGLSYARAVGGATVKLRGSWGRAIRAPSSGYASGYGNDILPNPLLGPERQQGFDTGLDLLFGSHFSLGATYYNQIAENLIQGVPVTFGVVQKSQYQNVGRVKNTGVELEGTATTGVLSLRAQYGYARARVERLAPNYTGDLRPGDQTLATPRHTAGASMTLAPLPGTTVAAGFTYLGSWQYYDYLALFGCFGGTSPCRGAFRDYLQTYPSLVKVSATISQRLTPLVSGFVSFDNLTNNQDYEHNNFSPVMGRITTVGFKFHY